MSLVRGRSDVTRRVPRPTGNPIRAAAAPPIDLRTALITFVVSWMVAQIVSSVVLAALGGGSDVADVSMGVLGASLAAAWVCYLVGMWIASDQVGTGRFADDYGVEFRPIDLLGVGIGVLSQLVVVNLIYLLLQSALGRHVHRRPPAGERQGPDRPGDGRLRGAARAARRLSAAPIVEELFYRGLLQRSLLARYSDGLVVVGVAMLFALVHFRVVEYPGPVRVRPDPRLLCDAHGPARHVDLRPHRIQPDRSGAGLVSEARDECDA